MSKDTVAELLAKQTMTPKPKVLKILDKYRDRNLAMGCEVNKEGTFYVANSDEYEQHWFCTPSKVAGGEDEVYYQDDINIDDIKVLGHPATPLVLLRALGTESRAVVMNGEGTISIGKKYDYGSIGKMKVICTIPNVTTLSEIPESDKMWQAVLDVLI